MQPEISYAKWYCGPWANLFRLVGAGFLTNGIGMTTVQAICLGAMPSWTPSLVVLAFLLTKNPRDDWKSFSSTRGRCGCGGFRTFSSALLMRSRNSLPRAIVQRELRHLLTAVTAAGSLPEEQRGLQLVPVPVDDFQKRNPRLSMSATSPAACSLRSGVSNAELGLLAEAHNLIVRLASRAR
jgi:hypothetical protein